MRSAMGIYVRQSVTAMMKACIFSACMDRQTGVSWMAAVLTTKIVYAETKPTCDKVMLVRIA